MNESIINNCQLRKSKSIERITTHTKIRFDPMNGVAFIFFL